MVFKILHVDAIGLISLQTLRQEQCALNGEALLGFDLIFPFVYFLQKFAHFIGVERRLPAQELITHDA